MTLRAIPRAQVTAAIPRGGAVVTTADLLLESGAGHWLFEDGSAIAWGADFTLAALENASGDWLFEDGSSVAWG